VDSGGDHRTTGSDRAEGGRDEVSDGSEDDQGKVWITYNSPTYLQTRHNLPADLLQNIAVIEPLAKTAAQQ